MEDSPAGQEISSILRHDDKRTSYKFALLRSVNDVVLNYPSLSTSGEDIGVPLQRLAEYWIAYYWPFVEPDRPIYQGRRDRKPSGGRKNDIKFRPHLTKLRQIFESSHDLSPGPQAGFFLIDEMRVDRKRDTFEETLISQFCKTRNAVKEAIKMPIRHAGPGHWSVFEQAVPAKEIEKDVIFVPRTKPSFECIIVRNDLWESFRELSLWIEALCIHEWCLFTENYVPGSEYRRGSIFELLTARPDNRVALNWERNQINILLMEGEHFVCPWTGKSLKNKKNYDLDHILPLSVYPINELWNLVPSDPHFNQHKKRDRLPSLAALSEARPRIAQAYDQYQKQSELNRALRSDLSSRFATIDVEASSLSQDAAEAVASLVDQIGTYRNLSRF